MKLTHLELSGFKSFADYTDFIFDDGITSIVGPNGCGKSNVVDAVKWVLGEMSAKNLRGDALLDVIFNGSSTRKPINMAEVSLTFTNENRRLPVDSDTVKVTRRLYRDATSEYLINNQLARLRDIRELFLDTGVGMDAYSLIEQGRVEALLDANSVDRREIFEEAAGISRFKQRKKEALRKLERIDQNLAQSQLVLEEIETRLRSVKIQAGRARSFRDCAARLRELRSSYVMQEYDGLYKKVVAQGDQLDEVVDELAVVRHQMEAKRTRQSELQMELESVQESARKAEQKLLAAQNEQSATKQRAEFTQQQIAQLSEQQELLATRQREINDRLTARAADVKQHEKQLAAIEGKLREHEGEAAGAALRQEQASKGIAGLSRSVDEHKSKIIDLMRQIARLHNDINGLTINQDNLTNQKTRLQQRKILLDSTLAELRTRTAELEAIKTELTERSGILREQAAAVRSEQQTNNQKMAAISQELARQREHRSALSSRQAVLSDLQSKRESVSQGVREVLKTRDDGNGFAYVKGIVAETVIASIENAAVIEAALGELQNALIVSDSSALAADAAVWQTLAGPVTVLATDRMPACPDGYDWSQHGKTAVAVIDLVTCDGENSRLIHQLLARTMVVETLADAMELAEVGPRGYRFVTRACEVVELGSVKQSLTLGDISKHSGMITRRAEVAKLQAELPTIEAKVTELTEHIAQCDQTSRELDARQQDLRQQIYQADSQQAEVIAQLSQANSQLQGTTSEAPLIAGELESIERQIAVAAERQKECENRGFGFEEEQKEVEAAVDELGAQMIVRQHEVSELAEIATRARIAMGQVQEQRSGVWRELATARQDVSQTQMECRRLAGELEMVVGRISDGQTTIGQSQEQLGELATQIAAADIELHAHTEQVTALRAESAGIAHILDCVQEQIEQLSQREHELSLSKNELSVRIETLIEHSMEELQINLHEAYANYQPAIMDWDAVAADINELRGKIARLGNVNLDAILEQLQLEERQRSLSAQLNDIVAAKRQLEELITTINEDSQKRFAESFAAVRQEFREMFRRLFGGGRADLILENPDDILESGIEIIARPPGKEPQSMSLLSGGEKTMTAVALVMSIFKSKPSPFCILDEVDAALDDANTARFAAIIQDFLQCSQFIVITHNKQMMTIASTLYGVTMQEQGVSMRVAVRFDAKGAAVNAVPGAPRPKESTAA